MGWKDFLEDAGFSTAKESSIPPVPRLSDDGLSVQRVNAGSNANVDAYQKAAWGIAQGQAQSIFQIGFMMYMMGTSINIWTFMMLSFQGVGPFRALLGTKQAFASLEAPGVSLAMPKLLYVAIHGVCAALVIWKVRGLGLIPTKSADWVWMLPGRTPTERSAATDYLL
jgi:hypothetical protein